MLGLVILIHEAGHFIMAKRAGILCHEFAIGMGPILYSKKKGETLYSIRAIPIGGFVSMAGEEISDELVKVGDTIRVMFDEQNPDVISHIIINEDDPKYQDALLLNVDTIDLKGKNEAPLYINTYEVKRNAYYVMKDKVLQIAPYERSFESKTLLQRFSTIFAGPFMNFILAFVLFVSIAFIVGLPQTDSTEIASVGGQAEDAGVQSGDELVSIGGEAVFTWDDIAIQMQEQAGETDIPFTFMRNDGNITINITPRIQFYNAGFSSNPDITDRLVIDSIGEGSPADTAILVDGDSETSLLEGDEITGIGYSEAAMSPVTTWNEVVDFMNENNEGLDMVIQVVRNGDTLVYEIGPFSHEFLEGQGVKAINPQIGIGPTYDREFFGSFGYGLSEVGSTMGMIFSTLKALFAESRVGVGDLAGPVGIYSITSSVIDLGLLAFISWMAILSVNLGIINLLPIPALDGGRIVFLGYEGIFRKPVNKKVENTLHFAMFVLLIGLFVFITFNDILRLFNIR
ncbi:MAG: RIP metalloprotease RseP [Bacillota bacterium]